MQKISHHAGVAIIESLDGNEFLFNRYDDNYIPVFRNSLHLIGGNHNTEDISPLGLLERELDEEFSIVQESGPEDDMERVLGKLKGPQTFRKEDMASESEIQFIKSAILNNLQPYLDFMCQVPAIDERQSFDFIYSVCIARLSNEVIECIKENLSLSKHIKNEGAACLIRRNDLSKEKMFGWGAGKIMEYYTGLKLNSLESMGSYVVGKPRETFVQYLSDFEYKKPVRKD